MATIFTRAAVAPFGAITIHRIVAGLMSAAADLRAWNETRGTINALRALSPAQLDDIGPVSYTHLTLPTTPYV